MLFIETAETLKTINLVSSLAWKTWPLTFVLFAFWIMVVIVVIFIKQNKCSTSNRRSLLIVLILLGFLPIGLNNFIARYKEIFVFGSAWQESLSDKLNIRLCDVDNNQQAGGSLCFAGAFYGDVKELIPVGQKIAIASDGIYALLLRNYLLPHYSLVTLNDESLNYFLIYLTPNKYQIAGGGDLLELQENGQTINHGRFEVVRILNQGMAILKKL